MPLPRCSISPAVSPIPLLVRFCASLRRQGSSQRGRSRPALPCRSVATGSASDGPTETTQAAMAFQLIVANCPSQVCAACRAHCSCRGSMGLCLAAVTSGEGRYHVAGQAPQGVRCHHRRRRRCRRRQTSVAYCRRCAAAGPGQDKPRVCCTRRPHSGAALCAAERSVSGGCCCAAGGAAGPRAVQQAGACQRSSTTPPPCLPCFGTLQRLLCPAGCADCGGSHRPECHPAAGKHPHRLQLWPAASRLQVPACPAGMSEPATHTPHLPVLPLPH